MPAVTTAYVRNIIKRGLTELVDPSPDKNETSLIWAHFESSCAFCGKTLRRDDRQGRIDHSLAASQGGSNSIGNRVLACGPCNDDEKLDQHWEAFLRLKAQSDDIFEARRNRIIEWQERNPIANEALHRELRAAALEKALEVIKVFDEKVDELRVLTRRTEQPVRVTENPPR